MQLFEGTVRSLSSEGLGVVNHPEGRVFFVAGAWPGDEGTFKIIRAEKRYGYAEIHELKKLSTDRVAAPCAYQGYGPGHCGGCPWMIGSYESQLKHKEYRLKHALDRAGLLHESTNFLPIQGSAEEFNYRNRAQFKTDGKVLGFVADSSHELIDIRECLVLNDGMKKNLAFLREKLPAPEWKPEGRYQWNFIDVDDDESMYDVLLNRRRPFKQGNAAQNQFMRDWVKQRIVGFNREERWLELFCGGGNFTSVFVESGFVNIVGVEVSKESILQLEAKKWPGVQAFPIDLAHPAQMAKLADRNLSTHYLFVDPPREGAKGIELLVEKLKKLKSIFYVSCDVATFVRDAAQLKALGFKIAEIQAVDLFPQTAHVEVLCVFERV